MLVNAYVGKALIGGNEAELRLIALGFAALVDHLDARGRPHPVGLDAARRHVSGALSRLEPSSRDIELEGEEGAGEMGPFVLTTSEAADRLRCSTSTVERLVRAGDLDAVRIGRAVRIRPEDLARYVAALPTRSQTTEVA